MNAIKKLFEKIWKFMDALLSIQIAHIDYCIGLLRTIHIAFQFQEAVSRQGEQFWFLDWFWIVGNYLMCRLKSFSITATKYFLPYKCILGDEYVD
jgi:hypothetical protein